MHTGDLLAHLLAAHGVEHVFGVPGGQSLPLYDATHSGRHALRHVVMRDERSLPYAAAAYARLTGRVPVIDATVGPGCVLLGLGLFEALHSSTPLVALVSDLPVGWHPMAELGTASQGMDQVEFLGPMTKWRAKAWTAAQVPVLVKQAFQKATGGRPGPTAVVIPEDVYAQEVDGPPDLYGIPEGAGRYPSQRPVPPPEQVTRALNLLLGAERPILVAGGGVLHSGATAELRALAEHLRIPVATTFTGKGALEEDHPLSLGVLGGIGVPPAEAAAREADLLFLVGYRSAQNSTFGWTVPAPTQTVIHLDIDPDQPGRFFPTAVGLVGDARAGLASLLSAARGHPAPDRKGWLDRVAAWKAAWARQAAEESASDASPVTPQRAVAEIVRVAGPEDVLVADASFASGWAAMYFPVRRAGRRVLLPRGMAGLGFGLPAAVGAKVGRPDLQVFCVAGDGGFAYSLAELATLKAYGLKVVSVVLNNRSWGWMEWLGRITYGKEYFALPDADFARAAEGLGCRGLRVERPDELREALDEAVRSPEAVVIDVRTELWETPIRVFRQALGARHPVGYLGEDATRRFK